ncbi:MAG: hypothetical protein LW832_03900 [Parachlamydia sp.]|jgi:hypothetical protein|nr:hypothetical protein [Parachlamydia sp.]
MNPIQPISSSPSPSIHQTVSQQAVAGQLLPPRPQKGPELTPSYQATQLASYFKERARLLNQAQTGKNQLDPAAAKFHAEAKSFRSKAAFAEGLTQGMEINEKAEKASGIAQKLGATINSEAHHAHGYGNMVGKEVYAGLTFMGAKWELRNLKAEREGIIEIMDQLTPDHEAKNALTTQKMHLDQQIAKQEEVADKTWISLLGTHIENSISAILIILSHSTDAAAKTAAVSGGAAMAGVGMITSGVGLISKVKEHRSLKDDLVKLERIPESHPNPKVANAIGAIKTAAIDRTAHFQAREIRLGIFNNAFSACQSAIAMSVSITAAVGASIGSMGIALPIISGVGLAVWGGVTVYQHRHTVARGLKGMLDSNRNPLSLERNLRFRQWRRSSELKGIFKNLEKLSAAYVRANPGEKKTLNSEIKQLSSRAVELKGELQDIRYKRAAQSLKDRTGSLAHATKHRKGAISNALEKIDKELASYNKALDEINQTPLDTYKKVHAKGLEKAEKKMEQFDAELAKLQTPTLKLKEQMQNLVEKQLGAKKDAYNQIPASDTTKMQAAQTEITQLNAYLADIDSRIQVEMDRLAQMKDNLQKEIDRMKNPTNQDIQNFNYSLTVEKAQLEIEKQLLLSRSPASAQAGQTSAEELSIAIEQLSDDEINDFVPHLQTLFPGLGIKDLDSSQNRKLYIKTQLNQAIAKNTLF